jgi:hypothetical protein
MLEEGSLPSEQGAAATIGFALLLWLPVLMFGFPLYRAIAMRWWIEGVRFGDVAMTSGLRKRSILWCYARAWLIGGVATGVFGILLQVGMQSAGVSFEDFKPLEPPPVGVMAILIGFYMIILLAMAVIMLQFVTRGIWQVTTDSIIVFNVAALDTVAARGAAAGSLGEGLADALDFGAGIGV